MKRPVSIVTMALGVAIAVILGGWWLWPSESPTATGYAGLGERTAGFATAAPGHVLTFPADHGPHPDYRIEWWYLTANLEAEDGRPFGVQWTLFRQALAPSSVSSDDAGPWTSRQLWMAHAALSTPEDHRYAERFARGMTLPDGEGQAGVRAAPFDAWIDDWTLQSRLRDDDLRHLRVRAAGDDFAYRLSLDADGPLVRHGEGGFSQKSADGQGSMYYSQPFYRVSGEVVVDDETLRVQGRAWLDREWSSQLLGPGQRGWDWFSLHLEDGAKLMAFRLRGGGDGQGGSQDYLSGSWIDARGRVTPLDAETLRLTPLETQAVAGRQLPIAWRVEVPDQALDVDVRAQRAEQWMGTSFAYWEGMVSVKERHSGEPRGVGYLEMTGY